MAHTIQTANSATIALHGFVSKTVGAAANIWTAVSNFIEALQVAGSRTEEIRRLNNLTDVELAEKYGINRDGIVSYVFRDKMF